MYALIELRNQHDAAMRIADSLIDLVDDYQCETDALLIALQFNKLIGLIRVHVAQEDDQLYPELIAADDPKVAKLALSYVSEMGGLATQLEVFARRWSSSALIATDFVDFAEGTGVSVVARFPDRA